MACRFPRASSLPLCSMTICSVMRSISSRMWLEISTVLPCEPSSRMTLIMLVRAIGSQPCSGSSRMMRSGSWTSAWAILTRCLMPLLYLPNSLFRTSARPTKSSTCSALAVASSRVMPWSLARVVTKSSPVIQSYILSDSLTYPILRYGAVLDHGSMPNSRTLPWLGFSRPIRSLNRVDLPAPLGPSTPVTPPSMARETSLRPMTCPYHFEAWSTKTAGVFESLIPSSPPESSRVLSAARCKRR